MAEELQLALLGNLDIRRGGVPLADLRSGKAQALLCYLAVTGRPHLRPALVGLLWGEMPEANGRSNLSKALRSITAAPATVCAWRSCAHCRSGRRASTPLKSDRR